MRDSAPQVKWAASFLVLRFLFCSLFQHLFIVYMMSSPYWCLSCVTSHWYLAIPVVTVTNLGEFYLAKKKNQPKKPQSLWAQPTFLGIFGKVWISSSTQWANTHRNGFDKQHSSSRVCPPPTESGKTNKLTLALSLRNEAQSKWFLCMDAFQIIIMTSNLSGHGDNLQIWSVDVKFHWTEHLWKQKFLLDLISQWSIPVLEMGVRR